MAGPGGALHLQTIAVIVVKLLQGLNQQVIDGKPDRASPVGIAAEETTFRFGRLGTNCMALAVDIESIRVLFILYLVVFHPSIC